MSASYSVFTSPNHAPIPNHLPTLIVTPHGQPHHTLYSYIHTNFNKETYLLTPSPQGDLCVAKMVPPPGSRGPGGAVAGRSDPGHASSSSADRSVRCEASRNLKWSITNTGINAPVYKLTLPNPDAPGQEQPLFQISKPNPNAPHWTMFYFTYAGHLIPPKRIEFGKIQKNAAQGSSSGGGGGGGTRVTITGKSPEEKAVWQTLGEGNEDMVEWIVLCAALNVLDEEIIKAAEKSGGGGGRAAAAAVPSSRPNAAQSPPQAPRAPATAMPVRAISPRPPLAGAAAWQGAGGVGPGGYPQQPAQHPHAPPPAGGGMRPPPGSYQQSRPPQQQGYGGGGAGYQPNGSAGGYRPQQQPGFRPPPPGAGPGYARPPPQQYDGGGGYPQQQHGHGGYPQHDGGGGYPQQQHGHGGYPQQQHGGYPQQQQGQPVRRF